MLPHVAVLSTGGTIASTEGTDGASPSKQGSELIEAVPELREYAEITVEQVAQRPSCDMAFETIAEIAQAAQAADDSDAAGVVVTHGTDTMEESAYYLDLILDLNIPVVLTGAQRRPDQVSPDGQGNLLSAVRAASHDRFEGGVYIAFNDEIHAARDVTKAHTSKLETFESPDKGPVAHATHDGFQIVREPKSYSPTINVKVPTTSVAMIKSASGVGARAIDHALDDGLDGIVVEGTGLGNTTSEIGDAIADAVSAGTAVVVTSRCYAGSTAAVYGGGGGGETLQGHGAIQGKDLPAHKARILLLFALTTTDNEAYIRNLFEKA